MPNFDTGHLFLTFLTPIKSGNTQDPSGVTVSHEQLVRATLGLLPTALQSPATQNIGENSPFSRNRMTHLCRLFVLEDTVYNGRNPQDAIVTSLRGEDPINPGPVDTLNGAYLIFCADVDAVMAEGDTLPATLERDQQERVRDNYLRTLWATMEPELRLIYGNCVGFDGVASAKDFAAYMARCQIETTMPFHDYWISPPDLPVLNTREIAIIAGVPAAATLVGLVAALFDWMSWSLFFWALLVTVIAVYGLYRYVMAKGRKPLPPAEYGDLPSVLKSLYLQQNFADFVIDNQGKDASSLHAAFADFLAQHRPGDKMAPSQAPGVISIRAENGIVKG